MPRHSIHKAFNALFFLAAVFILTGPACHGYDIEDEYAFASTLIASRDYDQAVISLRRYVLFSENESRVVTARFISGSLYDLLDRHDRAASCFLELARDETVGGDHREHAAFMAIQSMFLNKDLAGFHIQLDDLDSTLGGVSETGATHRRYLKGFLGVYAGSSELADLLPLETGEPDLVRHSVDLKQQFQFWETHPRKNPVTAGLLSTLIPGAGQFYNGRYWDGGVALGVILGGSYWTYDLFDRGEDSWGWTVGVLTGLLYFGQIRNAVIDSVKINERNELEFKQKLVDDYFLRFSLSVKQDDLRFGVSFYPAASRR
ncbi:MAG TPA: hypothetical protein PLV45_17090 [bacterium]|nr:hypothetical protein [bacterium]